VELYAGIEPIGGMVGVSQPPDEEEGQPAERTEEQEQAMFERIGLMLGATETENRKL
jgi:hypothetical protein